MNNLSLHLMYVYKCNWIASFQVNLPRTLYRVDVFFANVTTSGTKRQVKIRKRTLAFFFLHLSYRYTIAETRKGAVRNEAGKWIGNWYRTDARRLVVLSKFVRKSRYIHLALYPPRAKPAPSAGFDPLAGPLSHRSVASSRSASLPYPALETDAKNGQHGELSRFRLSQLSFYSWILMTAVCSRVIREAGYLSCSFSEKAVRWRVIGRYTLRSDTRRREIPEIYWQKIIVKSENFCDR